MEAQTPFGDSGRTRTQLGDGTPPTVTKRDPLRAPTGELIGARRRLLLRGRVQTIYGGARLRKSGSRAPIGTSVQV